VVLGSLAGALTLSLLTITQKVILEGDPFLMTGIVVPTLFGGPAGGLISFLLVRGREYSSELIGSHERLEKEVDERERAHDALRESSDWLWDFLDNANDLIQIISRHGRIIFTNQAWRETLGYSEEEVTLLSVYDIVHPDSRSHCKSVFQRVMSGESLSNVEAVFITKDGRPIAVEGNVNSRYTNDTVSYTRAIFRDVTERRKGEETLRKGEERYRSLFHDSPASLWEQDFSELKTHLNTLKDSGVEDFRRYFQDHPEEVLRCVSMVRVLDANQTTLELYEATSKEDLLGPLESIAYDETLNVLHEEIIAVAEDKLRFESETKDRTRQGATIDILLRWSVVPGHEKDYARVLVSMLDVTGRKRAEEALRESERTLSGILAASPIAIAIAQERKIKWINEAWVKMFHLADESDHVGRSTRILYPSRKEHERVGEVLYHNLAADVVNEADVLCTRKDGSIFDGNMRLTFFEPSDPHKGVVVACSDISERKKAEEKIQQQNEFLNSVLEALAHPLYVINTDDYTVTMANSAARFPSLSDNPTCYAVTHGRSDPCTSEEHPCPLEEVKSTGKPAVMEHVHYDIHGNARILEIHAYPIIDNDGNVKQIIEYNLDVTERKAAEDARLRLATAIEQSAESIIITDKEGIIQYVNPAFEHTAGYSSEEAIGKNPSILGSGKQDRAFYREMWTTLTSGRVWTGHLINKKKDGTLFEEKATISPIKDESGKIVSYVAAKRDVTVEVLLENQLRQAHKMEAIGTLTGGIAHDFNNRLHIIMGYTDMVLRDQDKSGRSYERLMAVRKAAQDGSDLIKGLLTFGSKVKSNLRPVDLNQEVERVQKLLYRTIPKMIKIERFLAHDLKTVNADPGQIEQVLLNLAVNAQHAMPEGGRLTIETGNVTLDEEYSQTHLEVESGRYVLLQVSDTGHGIEKDALDHIFEPFYTTKEPGEGTGLGLAMAYGIVRNHQGHIACYSEPGVGTTFRIYLPILTGKTESDVATTTEMPAFGTETILLVDDEELVRDLGTEMLAWAGYKVLTAANGQEALEVYRTKKADISLVILDLIMPKLGGKQCLEELLTIDPNVKVLVASGYSAKGPTKDAIELGARGFISKPYDTKEILSAVRNVLDDE